MRHSSMSIPSTLPPGTPLGKLSACSRMFYFGSSGGGLCEEYTPFEEQLFCASSAWVWSCKGRGLALSSHGSRQRGHTRLGCMSRCGENLSLSDHPAGLRNQAFTKLLGASAFISPSLTSNVMVNKNRLTRNTGPTIHPGYYS